MRAKPIFYLNGNERNFRDHYTISLRTGEPMPKKWQRNIELTPEEKARWDDSLKLDEEYRIAEAQGFPNGIPGGKMRGNILYSITQREEADGRNMQEDSFLRRPFIPQKTEIQNNNSIASSNTLAYGQSNAQPSFTFNRKLNTESPYIGQNNLLQMNTGIKKEPAFDVEQAIRKIASRLEERTDDSGEQDKMSLPTKLELYELLSPYGTTYKEIKEAYPQTVHDEEQFDESGMTYEEMTNIGK